MRRPQRKRDKWYGQNSGLNFVRTPFTLMRMHREVFQVLGCYLSSSGEMLDGWLLSAYQQTATPVFKFRTGVVVCLLKIYRSAKGTTNHPEIRPEFVRVPYREPGRILDLIFNISRFLVFQVFRGMHLMA